MTDMNALKAPPQPNPSEIVNLPVGQLLLDPKNPRLAWRIEGTDATQEALLLALWTEMDVAEVAWSIAENGFFPSEPLFVVIMDPQDSFERKYIAVEGNRRLAAVLLLCSEKLRNQIRATNLPDIDADRRAELETLPAIIYPDRESLWTTVGFRHINGIKGWDSFSKAKYVADVRAGYDIPLETIAERIGDKHATVKRLYRGYTLLEQAEAEGVFDREDTFRGRLHFSHLYTAADQRGFQLFLGIDPEYVGPNPVPKSNLKELEELLRWLYGRRSERVEPVVRTQNPDLRILREVISKPESLSILRDTNVLPQAHAVAIGDRQRFEDALIRAKLQLQIAQSTVITGYKGDERLYRTILELIEYAESIREDMAIRMEK